jgi:hypothetical protein
VQKSLRPILIILNFATTGTQRRHKRGGGVVAGPGQPAPDAESLENAMPELSPRKGHCCEAGVDAALLRGALPNRV